MYLPAHFREDSREAQDAFIRAHPLGLLVSHGPEGLAADLVPFCLYADEGERGVLRAHVARANPQWRILADAPECLVVFQGPDAYIRPGWYATKRQTEKVVPTWNYVTVHVRGRARVIADRDWLWRQLHDLTHAQEHGKPAPWKPTDAPAEFLEAQMKAIVGLEIPIARVEGKWKMSQNRDEADRQGVVAGLRSEPGVNHAAVADLVAARGAKRAQT